MKFRDPETGEVYDDIKDALEHYCPAKDDRDVDACKRCAIGSSKNTDDTICTDFSVDQPAEAARLMGYEVIEDEPYDSSGTCGICEHSKPFGIYGTVKCTKTDRYLPCEHKCDWEEDNMDKKDKPMSEWTLKEVHELCDNQDDCPGCPCYTAENGCMFCGEPTGWPLGEWEAMADYVGEDEQAIATDTDAARKPRLAEILGVEVGERFKIPGYGAFYIDEFGAIIDCEGEELQAEDLAECINHPERIIRCPRLTEPEIAIMRAVGAKWVSRDDYPDAYPELWEGKPELAGKTYTNSKAKRLCIVFREGMFQSVRPGDCICVEEAGGDA